MNDQSSSPTRLTLTPQTCPRHSGPGPPSRPSADAARGHPRPGLNTVLRDGQRAQERPAGCASAGYGLDPARRGFGTAGAAGVRYESRRISSLGMRFGDTGSSAGMNAQGPVSRSATVYANDRDRGALAEGAGRYPAARGQPTRARPRRRRSAPTRRKVASIPIRRRTSTDSKGALSNYAAIPLATGSLQTGGTCVLHGSSPPPDILRLRKWPSVPVVARPGLHLWPSSKPSPRTGDRGPDLRPPQSQQWLSTATSGQATNCNVIKMYSWLKRSARKARFGSRQCNEISARVGRPRANKSFSTCGLADQTTPHRLQVSQVDFSTSA